MTILFLFSGQYPGISAGSKRIALYHKALKESDVEVDVLSTFRLTKGRLNFYLNSILQPFIAFKTIIQHKNKSKLLFVYGYDWESLLLIRLATKIKRQKMVIEINEKPGTCYGNRITELPIVKFSSLYMLTRFALPLMDGFIVISENLREYVIHFKNKKSKILKIPILIDPNINKLSIENITLHKPFLLHAGALSERKDGIIGVFKAFALANKQLQNPLHFYLTDRVAPKDVQQQITKIIEQNNLQALVHFTNRLTENELLYYQQECSMLILNKPNNEQNTNNFPTKLGEYLRLKKPVIYTPVGEMANYLKDGYNAFKVPIDRHDLLAEKILFILNNKELENDILENGYSLAQNEFNYKMHGEKLKQFLKEISK